MARTGVLCTLFLALFTGSLAAQPAPPAMPQSIPLSEVSGAVNIGGNRVLLIADEGFHVELVSEASAAFESVCFKGHIGPLAPNTNGAKNTKDVVDDIEDVAWDPQRQTAFAITSHSRNRKEKDKPQRHKLIRLKLKDGKLESPLPEPRGLSEALEGRFPFAAEAMKKGHEAGGNQGTWNIEGLAFEPKSGHLFLGLRSPTQDRLGKPSAVVLVLRNPHAVFDSAEKPDFDEHPSLLDLGGLGIRGMTYDAERQGVWIVAGRSADPDTPADQVFSSVWFWDPSKADGAPEKATLDLARLQSLEGIALLERGGEAGLLLVSDDGDNFPSRYLWRPIPKLHGSP